MRASAQKAAQRTAAEVKPEEPPKESDSDKLDLSSEFTSQDMGLSSQGGTQLLDWEKIEDEDEEDKKRDKDEDGGGHGKDQSQQQQAEEWKAGDWQDKEDEPAAEALPGEPEPEIPNPPPSRYLPPQARSQPTVDQQATDAESTVSAQERATTAAPNQPPTTSNAPVAVVADAEAPALQLSWDDDEPAPQGPALELSARGPRDATKGSIALPERLRPAAQLALPIKGQLEQIEPQIAQAAGQLISTPAHEPGYEECVRLLSRFGLGALRMCARAKVSVQILDESGFASHPELWALDLTPEETPSDGAYLVDRRIVLVDRRCLVEKPRFFHPALYYFAHAFDHAQGGETFSSRKAAAVVACFEASTRAFNGFDFVDELAAADPVRYFARSVAVYLGRDDCTDPLWSHQDLFDFDRSMFDYLQYLFARLTA